MIKTGTLEKWLSQVIQHLNYQKGKTVPFQMFSYTIVKDINVLIINLLGGKYLLKIIDTISDSNIFKKWKNAFFLLSKNYKAV